MLSTSPPSSPSEALNVVPAAQGTCGAEAAQPCSGEGRISSSRARFHAVRWELDRRAVPPASSTGHLGLLVWFLAAATDCSSYFKLGVKGTTFQKCEHTSLCYAPSWVCDGANDCGDYSDERNCPGESGERKPLTGCSPLGSVWAEDALFAHWDHHPLPVQLCSWSMWDHRGLLGEESFGVRQFWVGRRQDVSTPPPLLTFPSQTRWEETQVSSQLLCLPEREVHPHDLDLRQRG